MKKILLLFLCLLLCGCSQEASGDVSNSNVQNSFPVSSESEPFDEETAVSLYDFSGEMLSFKNGSIKSVNLNYVLGWNFDSEEYIRFSRGDKINGFYVWRVSSLYFFDEFTQSLICNENSIELAAENDHVLVDGIIMLDENGNCVFCPYLNENGENFPFMSPRDEGDEMWYKEESRLSFSDGETFDVYPVNIYCSRAVDDAGNGERIDKDILSEMAGVEAGEFEYLKVRVGVTNLFIYADCDGEDSEIFGTRGSAWVDSVKIIG